MQSDRAEEDSGNKCGHIRKFLGNLAEKFILTQKCSNSCMDEYSKVRGNLTWKYPQCVFFFCGYIHLSFNLVRL